MKLRTFSLCWGLLWGSLLGLAGGAWAATPSANVRVNSVGLVPQLAKRATVLNAASALSFTVKLSADDSVLFSGVLSAVATNSDTGESYRTANFDALSATGLCYVDVAGLGRSVDFMVSPDAYNASLRLNLLGFYNQRCGTATNMTWNGTTWGHPACHLGDAALYYYDGSSNLKDATGGWHDAGDYNKYVINAGAALGPMLHAFERNRAKLEGLTVSSGVDPAVPDYLEEAKWELDWLRKMQFPDGRVSDKVTVWGGFESYWVAPENHLDQRYFTTWGTAEIGVFTAVMALGARVFAPYDPSYAATLQSAADLSYAYLQANPANVTANISGTPQGNYTQNDGSARLWAAVEMWETTGSATALADAETRINALADKSNPYFDWGNLYTLGTSVYALSTRAGRNATLLSTVKNAFTSDAGGLVGVRNTHGYGRASTSYYWGSNGVIARFSYVLDTAYRINPNQAYLDCLQDQLSWIYGRNYYNRSQVTGEGLNPPLDPHDRASSNDGVVAPRPGHLVGGGDSSATNWLDDHNYANLNEIAINWDGAMTYALATLSGWQGPTPTPTPTPTASPSISPTFSASPTITETPTESPTFTISPTFTVSPTVTESFTESPTFTVSPTATLTATPSVSPTCSPGQALGAPPAVLRVQPVPQPAHRPMLRLKVELDGAADTLWLGLYSAAYARAVKAELPGSYQPGWNQVLLPVPELGPGVYFLQLRAGALGAQGPPGKVSRVVLLP